MNSSDKHKVFISYYHQADQDFKDNLVNKFEDVVFIDESVGMNDIDDTDKTSDEIRQIIRDDYLKDSTVTIVLVSEDTKKRKHVDWEIFSSMYDGKINKKSGILVINTSPKYNRQVSIDDSDKHLFPQSTNWNKINYKNYEYLPDRLLDNLKNNDVKINIVNYDTIMNNPSVLSKFIDIAYNNRINNNYDLSRDMKRAND